MGDEEERPSGDAANDDDPSSRTAVAQFYYYQHPKTGTVSSTPLTVEQLVKLLVPFREGMAAILPPHTQCLAVRAAKHSEQEESSDGTSSFGEWQSVSTVHVLKEAACAQWYLTGGEIAGKDPQGPSTCRSILEAYTRAQDKSKLLAFAQGITSAWTPVDQLPHLQQVLQALLPAAGPPNVEDIAAPAAAETNTQDDAALRNSQEVQDELEAFLSATAAAGDADDEEDDDDHAYESDGGTRYVKDPLSGHWIHEALAPPKEKPKGSSAPAKQPSKAGSLVTSTTDTNADNNHSKKSHKKAKFSKRNARHWIYVSGLPTNKELDMAEVHKFFGKVGLLDLDPETMHPKIKLYRTLDGKLKGDASMCYARPESIELALQVLDESPWDEHHTIRVERAKFEAKQENKEEQGETSGKRRRPISQAQRKVARLALLQAQDEGFGVRLAGGRKGLRIVVVKHMLDGISESDWESTIQDYCQELEAAVEKITCISKTKVVILKFAEPTAAALAVDAWNGKVNPKSGTAMEALYWDGVTDYTGSSEAHNPEEEQQRHEEFGKWLDDQGEDDLPPELRLQVAED